LAALAQVEYIAPKQLGTASILPEDVTHLQKVFPLEGSTESIEPQTEDHPQKPLQSAHSAIHTH
jgi:hypothetical protein